MLPSERMVRRAAERVVKRCNQARIDADAEIKMGSTGFEPVTSSVSTKRSPPELTARAPTPEAPGHTRNYSGAGAVCKRHVIAAALRGCVSCAPGSGDRPTAG